MRQTQDSLRHFLRRATAEDHVQAEAVHWNGAAFHNHAAYLRFLRALHVAHFHLGLPAAQVLGDTSEYDRHKNCIAQIESDLGAPFSASNSSLSPPCPSVSTAWGITYALVGSALGAASILRHLSDGQSEWPKAYLQASHAFATCGGVKGQFDALDQTVVDRSQSLFGARAVFQCIETSHPPNESAFISAQSEYSLSKHLEAS